jgi:hypothetical protein
MRPGIVGLIDPNQPRPRSPVLFKPGATHLGLRHKWQRPNTTSWPYVVFGLCNRHDPTPEPLVQKIASSMVRASATVEGASQHMCLFTAWPFCVSTPAPGAALTRLYHRADQLPRFTPRRSGRFDHTGARSPAGARCNRAMETRLWMTIWRASRQARTRLENDLRAAARHCS